MKTVLLHKIPDFPGFFRWLVEWNQEGQEMAVLSPLFKKRGGIEENLALECLHEKMLQKMNLK